jgi:hypothetical protein
MNQPGSTPWSYFLFGGVCTFLIIQLHGLGLSTKAKLAIAAPPLALMVGFYAIAPESILGPPRLTMIMYAGTLMMAVIVWVLMWVARLIGVPRDKLAASPR